MNWKTNKTHDEKQVERDKLMFLGIKGYGFLVQISI